MHLPDIRTDDVDALRDGEEDVAVQGRTSRETDDHEVTTWAEVVDGLFVCGAGRGGDDGGVGAESVCGVLNVLDEVLALLEVNPFFCAELEAEITLLGAGI
jgi:hypothetical protein